MSLLSITRSDTLACAPQRPARRLGTFLALARQRRDLARLDAHLLEDIGVSRAEARDEAARPVWGAPASWR